jgi:transposase InsO family protein
MRGLEKVAPLLRATVSGVTTRTLYYEPRKPAQDWQTKQLIEAVLRDYPSYGSRRIALHLKRNRKQIKRVMNLFGIKAYRRRGRRWKKAKKQAVQYPNLLFTVTPVREGHIWVSDFTHVTFKGRDVYIATVMDIYTRKIVGLSVLTSHALPLVMQALMSALQYNRRPEIYHSDNGSEYNAEVYIHALATLGISISRSRPGCPWENGYQESFYSQFKVDLGDPNRFRSLGELVYEIYHTIYIYNHSRIHSALKMAPYQFANAKRFATMRLHRERVQ